MAEDIEAKNIAEVVDSLIRGGRREDKLVFIVEDDGVGIDIQVLAAIDRGESASAGYGISNVRLRLSLRYGELSSCTVGPRPGGGTRVVVEVPFIP